MAAAVPPNRKTVLIVEDESPVRLSAVAMIEDPGYDAISASNADEAIRLLESRNDIRAVFTDINMPGSIDGLRLARVVRKRWPPVALQVTSGLRNCSALPDGGRFLAKPYQPTELEKALRELIC